MAGISAHEMQDVQTEELAKEVDRLRKQIASMEANTEQTPVIYQEEINTAVEVYFDSHPIPKGEDGAGATVRIGDVATGTAGSKAAVTNVGTTRDAVFNFTIPRGADGTNAGPHSFTIGYGSRSLPVLAPNASATYDVPLDRTMPNTTYEVKTRAFSSTAVLSALQVTANNRTKTSVNVTVKNVGTGASVAGILMVDAYAFV